MLVTLHYMELTPHVMEICIGNVHFNFLYIIIIPQGMPTMSRRHLYIRFTTNRELKLQIVNHNTHLCNYVYQNQLNLVFSLLSMII